MAKRKAPTTPAFTEADLAAPVKAYFESQGYTVRAEVKDCDIVAMKDDELIVVELKRSANMTLLVQATKRQTITHDVFVALPEPPRRNRHFRGVIRVIKQLGLGLMLVRFGAAGNTIRVEHEPAGGRRRNRRLESAVIAEAAARSGDYNVGGQTRTPIVTAYKETAIFIACCLEQHGPMSPKKIREMGGGDKARSILAANHFEWFERVSRGVYKVTRRGVKGTRDYPEIRALCLNKINDMNAPE